MKRILLSIVIAFLLLVVYLAITSVMVVYGGFNRELILYVQIPVRLPQIIFYYFSPPTIEDYEFSFTQRKAVLMVLFFLINILLYSIPIYFLLGLFSRFRKPKETPSPEPPPPPPF